MPYKPLMLWVACCFCIVAVAPALVFAEEAEGSPEDGPMEEIVVIGRLQSAATDVVSERLEQAVPVDFLDAESISRAGDSDVASALRRMPGLTLVADKFVYVRGLGERYSSTQLNGASVPSPDLSRNVLPLDIFPAEILDSIAVQKGYSADLPAAFGGGNIDIRTKGIPLDRMFSITLNTGWNTNSSDQGLSYSGGGDDWKGEDDGSRALSPVLSQAIQTYQGSFGAPDILNILRRDGSQLYSLADAQQINRELATQLNRNVDVREKDLDPDLQGKLTAGYRWFFGEDWEVGFLATGSYEDQWRNTDRTIRRVSNPDTDVSSGSRTVNTVNLTGMASIGVKFTDDHEIQTMGLFIRNTEDEAAIYTTCQQGQFNDCAVGSQGRISEVRYENRDLEVGQIKGSHTLGDATLDLLPGFLDFVQVVRGLEFGWYYSDSETTSDIPNEVRISAQDSLDPATGQILMTSIRQSGTAGDFRWSDLTDQVLSYGWDVSAPFYGSGWDVELAGGYDYVEKVRDYRQTSMGLGSTSSGFSAISGGTPSQVFSDANILDPVNGIALLLGVGGFGLESYFAGQITDAAYGKFDLLLDETWRISAGARYEEFRQISVPVDLLNFSGQRIPLSADEIARGAILEDDWYPSVALTYILPGFWAEEFQFRFAWSETVARPDIREVSQSTYIDPITDARVRGNPLLRPSDLSNYDIRAEWFFESGDNFTVSLFYKDIDSPIETVQGGATEDNILFNFVNATSAEVYGVEFEGLKNLRFMADLVGRWVKQFYVAGNLTLSESNLDIVPGQGGVGNITNASRSLTQHSDWVANVQLGFDSFNGRHGATLVY
ncbi:MAG: outer membrane beta-barrel protein, partial [Proteobacteria bacterium]|nr:outer membrane beta-barrel protein [Pseudomonadota bacterium]